MSQISTPTSTRSDARPNPRHGTSGGRRGQLEVRLRGHQGIGGIDWTQSWINVAGGKSKVGAWPVGRIARGGACRG